VKKFIVNLLVITSLLVIPVANTFSESIVAVLDLSQAVAQSDFAKQKLTELRADKTYIALVEEIKRLEEALKAMEKKEKVNNQTWTDEEKKKHRQEMQKTYDKYNHLINQESNAQQSLLAALVRDTRPKWQKVVENIIKERKITVLLKAGAVDFVAPEFNITVETTQRLNSAK